MFTHLFLICFTPILSTTRWFSASAHFHYAGEIAATKYHNSWNSRSTVNILITGHITTQYFPNPKKGGVFFYRVINLSVLLKSTNATNTNIHLLNYTFLFTFNVKDLKELCSYLSLL